MVPYQKQSGEAFETEALGTIIEMPRDTHLELRDIAVTTLMCFTALRVEDVDKMKERMITFCPSTKSDPRRMLMVLDQTKNDKTGTGPLSGRSFVVACIYGLGLEGQEKKDWKATLKKNPDHPCGGGCPYGIQVEYREAKPYSTSSSSTGEKVDVGALAYCT
jgi:hypothetical protein